MDISQFAASFFAPWDKLDTHSKAKACSCLLAHRLIPGPCRRTLGCFHRPCVGMGMVRDSFVLQKQMEEGEMARFLPGWEMTLLGARENTEFCFDFMERALGRKQVKWTE